MSKVPKDQIKEQKLKIKRRSDDKFAYRTVIISCIFGIIFYITSLLFNIGIISIFVNGNLLFNILEILIKITTILLFFLFMMVSLGNFKELTGNPLSWKELILLFILSLGQTLLNLLVFTLTFIGLIVIIIYFYLVQEL
ncbi:MAG: hypothetical protein ACFE8B_07915 [Candidatus Hermodarchaeota archaeon]